MIPLITDFTDPTKNFVEDHMPDPLFSESELGGNSMKKAINDQMAKDFASHIKDVSTDIMTIYSLIHGQLTPALISEIEAEEDFNLHAAKYDALWLFQVAKLKAAGVASRGNPYRSMFDILLHFMTKIRQGQSETEENWYRRFKSECKILAAANLDYIFYFAHGAGHNDSDVTPTGQNIEEAMEACKAIFFLKFSNMRRYPSLMNFLTDSEMVKDDKYPTTLVGVYKMLLEYKKKERLKMTLINLILIF